MANKDIEQMISDGKGRIANVAYKTARCAKIPGMDAEDIMQELMIHAVGAARKYDESAGIPWLAFLSLTIRRRAIDLVRQRGTHTRGGVRRQSLHYSIDGSDMRSQNDQLLEPEDAADEMADVDMRDLLEQASRESLHVHVAALYYSGLTMREAGEMVGRCESRVSWILGHRNPGRDAIIDRLRELAGVPRCA